MRVAGLDLAGSPKNQTGYCLLTCLAGGNEVVTRLLRSDEEIMAQLAQGKPDLVAVDAPLLYDGVRRRCDDLLRQYGALPVTLKGMETLALRGRGLAARLKAAGLANIEVHAVSCAKILGVWHKDDFTMQKAMMGLNLQGDVNTRILTRDELDAIMAAVTGYLHLIGQAETVGGADGVIVVPKV
jgi:uncharacterized protein